MAEIKRNDFVFTIGYQGDTAIVDGSARKRYGRMSATQLLDEGLLRPAVCAALYDEVVETFLPRFVEKTGIDVRTKEDLQRLFGVFGVSDAAPKVSVIS